MYALASAPAISRVSAGDVVAVSKLRLKKEGRSEVNQ